MQSLVSATCSSELIVACSVVLATLPRYGAAEKTVLTQMGNSASQALRTTDNCQQKACRIFAVLVKSATLLNQADDEKKRDL